jgi:hypothetical protein
MMARLNFVVLSLCILPFLLQACGGGGDNRNINTSPAATAPSSNSENSNTAKTNVEELGIFINVPYEAIDVVWKEYPASKQVVAVLRFSPEDANKIVTEAAKLGPPQSVSVATQAWFPDELIAQSDMSGDSALKGLSYRADAFYQEPYTNGKMTRIEGSDYFVLEMSAK